MNLYETALAYFILKEKNSVQKREAPLSPGRWESVKLVQFFFRHTQKKGMVRFFYIENTQKTILKTRLYELIRSAFSQPLYDTKPDQTCNYFTFRLSPRVLLHIFFY